MTEQAHGTAGDMGEQDAVRWGLRFEAALLRMLRQYLDNDPPPADSPIGRDAALWAENLGLRDEARRMGRMEETPRKAA